MEPRLNYRKQIACQRQDKRAATINVHCVSKNVPPLLCYNFDIREHILTFFGRNVTHRVSNQNTLLCHLK